MVGNFDWILSVLFSSEGGDFDLWWVKFDKFSFRNDVEVGGFCKGWLGCLEVIVNVDVVVGVEFEVDRWWCLWGGWMVLWLLGKWCNVVVCGFVFFLCYLIKLC